ncbi:Cdc46/Mcm ATPase [Ordospora colligata]|nr:Cdc46/Mcm ATPase [Ordospora colligata]
MEVQNEIDLIQLCERNPELANSIAVDVSAHPDVYRKTLKNIPCALFSSRALNSKNINKIVTVEGTVIKVYEVLIRNVSNEMVCLKCNSKTYAKLSGNKKQKTSCDSCGSSVVKDKRSFGEPIPSQRIRLQDIGNSESMSETLEIVLEKELAGKFYPGDKLLITGVILTKWKIFRAGEQMLGSMYMHALDVYKHKEESMNDLFSRNCILKLEELDRFERRLFLIRSFAEEIEGFENVKLGLLLALISGSGKPDGKSTRSNTHVLLVGDAGMGKSHMLKTCIRLVSPAVLINGTGTTQAGLTTCAVKQGKEWTLEAGALVLADTGICCIDEFNKLRLNEKNGLLEAMEQQTLSIAKAGMVSSLNTRCSVIASAGTKYRYDLNKSVSENTTITTPLISRFDLIFGMFDGKNEEFDTLVAEKILSRKSGIDSVDKGEMTYWIGTMLRNYISMVRKQNNVISEDLNEILLGYYHYKRRTDGINEFNTIRMLESLVRLTEAHSKLMNSECTSEDDAYAVILLLEASLGSKPLANINIKKMFLDETCYNNAIYAVKEVIKINGETRHSK